VVVDRATRTHVEVLYRLFTVGDESPDASTLP